MLLGAYILFLISLIIQRKLYYKTNCLISAKLNLVIQYLAAKYQSALFAVSLRLLYFMPDTFIRPLLLFFFIILPGISSQTTSVP